MALFGGDNNSNNITINITANDNATQTIRNIRSAIDDSMYGGSKGVSSVSSSIDEFATKVGRLGVSFAYIGNQMGKLNDGIISTMKNIGSQGVSYIQTAIDKYRELSKVQGELVGVIGNNIDPTTGLVNKELNTRTSNTIIDNAKRSAQSGKLWSESDYIGTATELAKTGIEGIADNYDTMEQLMKFKTANGLTDEEMGQTLAILQQRDKNINDPATMMRYLNQIQASADLSPADVSDVIKAMSYGDPLARSNGMDFASEMALIAGFSSGGYTGSQGGTMLRRTLQNVPISELKLAQLSKVKKQGLEDVGVLDYWGAFVDELGQYDSSNDSNWTKRFALLNDYVGGDKYKNMYGTDMSENQQMAFAYTLLGTQGEALPSLLTGMGFNEQQVKNFMTAGEGTGVEDKYSAKESTLDGAMTRLENAFESVTAEVGSKFAPLIMEFVNEIFGGKGLNKGSLKKLWNDAISGLTDMAKDFLPPETIKSLKSFGDKIFDFVWALGDTSLEILPQVLDRLINIADTLLSAFDGGDVDYTKLSSALFQFFNIFKDLDLSGIKDADTKNIAEGITGILNFLQQVGTFGDGLSKIAVLLVGFSSFVSMLSPLLKVLFGGGSVTGSTGGLLGKLFSGFNLPTISNPFGGQHHNGTTISNPFGGQHYNGTTISNPTGGNHTAEGQSIGTALASGIKTAILEAGIPLAVAGLIALCIKKGIEVYENSTGNEKTETQQEINSMNTINQGRDELASGQDLNGDGFVGINYGSQESNKGGDNSAHAQKKKDYYNNKYLQEKNADEIEGVMQDYGLLSPSELASKKGKYYNGKGQKEGTYSSGSDEKSLKIDAPLVVKAETQPVAQQPTTQIVNNNGGTPATTPAVTTNLNNQTNLQNTTNLSSALNVSMPWNVNLTLPITVHNTQTITKTVSGNRTSTKNTQSSLNNGSSTSNKISGQR